MMSFHDELVDASLHVPGYIQAGDPGAVGAGMLWFDTTNKTLKIRNATNTGWDTAIQTPLSHTHVETDITDLGTYLTEAAADLLYATLAHTHVEADITDLDKYTQQEVDDLIAAIDISEQAGAAIIPHYNKGNGDPFSVHCFGGFVYCGDASASESVFVHPRDFIIAMNGGAATPSYTYDIKKIGGSYVGSNSDPTVPALEVTADDQTLPIIVYVSDGTTVRETEMYLVCQGITSF